MPKLILASASTARQAVLAGTGLDFETRISHVDENEIKAVCAENNIDIATTALKLAQAKAIKISQEHDGLVIGADQILSLEGKSFDKPTSMAEAATRLRHFSGKTHYLHNGLCVALSGDIIWNYTTAPAMTMRTLTGAEIDTYLSSCDDSVLGAVGAYHLEGKGVRLFEKIEGDYFSILGLPLLPLLAFLRPRLDMGF